MSAGSPDARRESRFAQLLRRVPAGRLARNTVLGIMWSATRVGMQAVWLVVVARLLGPAGYGSFAGVAGLANAVAGFVGLGLGLVMYQDVANHPERFGLRWRQTVTMDLATALFFAAALLIFSGRFAGGLALTTVFAIALSELVGFPLTSAAAFAFGSHERMGWSVAMPALLAVARLLGLALFHVFGDGTLASYAWFHAGASLSYAAAAVVLVHVLLKPASVPFSLTREDLSEGLGFSVVWATANAMGSFDKALVLRFSGAEIAGLYASAYRIANVLAVPMDALLTAALPRLFREGGGTLAPRLVPRLFVVTLGYGVFAGAVLWFAADLVPLLLGAKFAAAAHAARGLAWFLPFFGVRYLGSNILMAKRCKTERVVLECGGIVMMIVFAAWWLPQLGLDGAIRMIIATEALLAIATWAVVWRAHRRPAVSAPAGP